MPRQANLHSMKIQAGNSTIRLKKQNLRSLRAAAHVLTSSPGAKSGTFCAKYLSSTGFCIVSMWLMVDITQTQLR